MTLTKMDNLKAKLEEFKDQSLLYMDFPKLVEIELYSFTNSVETIIIDRDEIIWFDRNRVHVYNSVTNKERDYYQILRVWVTDKSSSVISQDMIDAEDAKRRVIIEQKTDYYLFETVKFSYDNDYSTDSRYTMSEIVIRITKEMDDILALEQVVDNISDFFKWETYDGEVQEIVRNELERKNETSV